MCVAESQTFFLDDAAMNERAWKVCHEACAVSLGTTTPGADRGGSGKCLHECFLDKDESEETTAIEEKREKRENRDQRRENGEH